MMAKTMTRAPKQLILGLLAGMTLETVRPFFRSLEKSGYQGDVCMIVSELDKATAAFLRACRVELIPFEDMSLKRFWARLALLPGFFMPRRERLSFESRLAPAYMHPHCARHFFYQSYLQECAEIYSHVMLTDVRDVLFQADPFAFELPDGLCVFQEDPSKTIGTDSHNANSMLRGFGPAVLRELQDKPIVCAGTTIGTASAIREHLAAVVRLFCAKRQRHTIDQAVHNYLIRKEPPARLHLFENFSGPVLTMALVNPARVPFNNRGQIINTDGSVVNTLHQYDRHLGLAEKLLKNFT